MNIPAISLCISQLATGTQAVFEYSRHYGVDIEFRDGTFTVFDGRLQYGEESTASPANFARMILKCAEQVRELLAALPEGNAQELGGVFGLAEATWKIEFAKSYMS